MSEFLSDVLHPQRARSSGRPSWWTAVGLVLVPLLIGGLLVWALWKPDERLDRIEAAVVNQDEPVTVDGQTVPLGRQLAAGLVTSSGATDAEASGTGGSSGSSDEPANVSGHDSGSNFTWVITSADDAATGLADGRYATVVTIPAGFSAAATSVGTDPANAQQATIDIATSERSRPVDAAVAQAVTSTAVRVLSGQLTTTYLQNVFVGFDTLRDSLSQASDGASQLASGASGLSSGASSVSSGASSLASGLGELASGASSASSGASSLSSGVRQLASGASSLSSGASSLSSGVGQVASGASSLASGLDQLAAGASDAATTAQAGVPGAQQFAAGLDQLNAGIGGSGGLGDKLTAYRDGVATALTGLQQLAALCSGSATSPDMTQPQACAALQSQLAAQANAADETTLLGGATALDAAVNTSADAAHPSIRASLASLAAAGDTLAAGVSSSATGLQQLASAAQQSATGAHQLADGAAQSAGGASSLASGASALASGARQSASGASSLASGVSSVAAGAQQSSDGASSLADGAGQLATGATDLGTGATSLADGLGGAADQVPSYSTDQADNLARVVADPVAATGTGTTSLFGGGSVPFFLVVALWIGGLATFVVLGSTAPRAVGSTRSSLRLALSSFAPGALVGVVQGLALTAAMAKALDLTPGGWVAFASLAALVGVAFAAVNQGLVAAFRGTGRFVAVVVAVVGLATAVVSTVPQVLDAVAGVLPISPARAALQGVVTGDGVAGAVALLVVWALVGLGLTTAAVARRRVVPAGRLARWVRAA